MADKERHQGEENKKQSIKRVIFEKQDGTIIYLDGEQAAKWSDTVNSPIMNGFIHDRLGQDELGPLQWKQATSFEDILHTTRTAFDEDLEMRIDAFRKILPENPGLENYLKMIRSGAKAMTHSSPKTSVLSWLDEQIKIAKMGKGVS